MKRRGRSAEKTLVVCGQGGFLLGQVSKTLPTLLLTRVSHKRLAAATLGRLATIGSTNLTLHAQSGASLLGALPRLAGHPRHAVAYTVGWRGTWESLEGRHGRVLQVVHVGHPQVVVHFLGESGPQFQLLGRAGLLLVHQWRDWALKLGLGRAKGKGIRQLVFEAGAAAASRHERPDAVARRKRRVREAR